jgi:hypothetical protein
MLALSAKIIARIREYGVGHVPLLVRREMAYPRYQGTRWLRAALVRMHRLFGSVPRRDGRDNNLQFVYDLSVSPITFDFATHVAAAEIERRRRGLDGIDVFLILGDYHGVREETRDYERIVGPESRQWRIRQILLPILSFMPTVHDVFLCADRAYAATLLSNDPARLYPADFHPRLPRVPENSAVQTLARSGATIWPLFRATAHAKVLIGHFLEREAKGRLPVVITLRNYAHAPQRNSRYKDWLAFADSLDRTRYAAIFVNDSETFMQEPPVDLSRHIVCDAASANLEIRMALYEMAWLNIAVLAGPTELTWYNEQARYVYFLPIGRSEITKEDVLIQAGHRIGESLPFAKPYQRIVWELDEIDAIKREFAEMETMLASQQG